MRTLSIIVTVGCLLVGCSSRPTAIDDEGGDGRIPDPGNHVNKMAVVADVNHLVFDRPITITTGWIPVMAWKGSIGLIEDRVNGVFDPILLDSTNYTVKSYAGDYLVYIPVELKASQLFIQNWHIQLMKGADSIEKTRHYTAYFEIDSIFIADSNRMYAINSDVVRKTCPSSLGWAQSELSSTLRLNP